MLATHSRGDFQWPNSEDFSLFSAGGWSSTYDL
jgi:hypothetical protein